MLAGGVAAAGGEGSEARDAREHRDPAAALHQGIQGGLGAVHRAEEVDLHHPADHLHLGVAEAAQVGDSRVVDQDVHPAVSLDHPRDGIAAASERGHVALDGQRTDPSLVQVGCQRLEGGAVDVEEADPGSVPSKAARESSADAPGSAGDDHAAPFESAGFAHDSPGFWWIPWEAGSTRIAFIN